MGECGVRHVFVYGTLRRGESNDIGRLLPAPVLMGAASVQGSLFDLGPYPGLRLEASGPAPDGWPHGPVRGEVYRITPALEALLDRIEEVAPEPSGEYLRRTVRVQLAAASPGAPEGLAAGTPPALDCLVYELATDRAPGRPRIAGGDWVQWRLKRG